VIFSRGVQAREILREARAMASAAKLPVLFVEDGLKAEPERLPGAGTERLWRR